MSLRTRTRRLITSLALASASLGAMAFGGTPVASAAYIEAPNPGYAYVRSCPPMNMVATPCGIIATLAHRRGVTMTRWCDAAMATGRYPSNRWFKITAPVTGWVHSSYVEGQNWTPWGCS